MPRVWQRRLRRQLLRASRRAALSWDLAPLANTIWPWQACRPRSRSPRWQPGWTDGRCQPRSARPRCRSATGDGAWRRDGGLRVVSCWEPDPMQKESLWQPSAAFKQLRHNLHGPPGAPQPLQPQALQGPLPARLVGLRHTAARQQPLLPAPEPAQCKQEKSHKQELFMAE